MSDEIQENHNSGLLYFMPHWIFESNELSSTDKLVYALLSGLAFGNEKKECFPSDEYIAKRLGFKKQQANISVANLCKFGALEKRTESHPKNAFRKIRYIRIFMELKKCLPDTENRNLEDTENRTLRVTENRTYSNKGNSNKERERESEAKASSPAPFVFKRVQMERAAFGDLITKHGDEKIKEMLERLDEYADLNPKRFKQYANHATVIAKWIREDEQKPAKKKENAIKANKKWAKEFEDKMKYVAKFEAYASYVEFRGMGNAPSVVIKYDENGFKEQVLNQTRKMGLIQFWDEE